MGGCPGCSGSVPGTGGTQFEVFGESGEPENLKDFNAVILHHHPMRGYYKSDYSGGNQTPDCGSLDGITGIGSPGGNCSECPMNVYGSGKNKSKACKVKQRLYLLREGELFPMLLTIPTGSLSMLSKYLKVLIAKRNTSATVVTQFSIKRETNQTGIAYPQVKFAVARKLTPDEIPLIKRMSSQIKEYSQNVGLDGDNSSSFDEVEEIVDPETGEVTRPLTGGEV